jgi:hypothetical protein
MFLPILLSTLDSCAQKLLAEKSKYTWLKSAVNNWNKLKLYFWKYTSANSVDFWKNRFSEFCIFHGILCENEKILPNKMCFVLHCTHKKNIVWANSEKSAHPRLVQLIGVPLLTIPSHVCSIIKWGN